MDHILDLVLIFMKELEMALIFISIKEKNRPENVEVVIFNDLNFKQITKNDIGHQEKLAIIFLVIVIKVKIVRLEVVDYLIL